MTCKVELIPISEGNRIAIKENDTTIVGRGSSLGCNDKKISRQHAEILLKKDATLWIKPTHSNPVFYRPLNGKTVHLTKDVEQELKHGDQIGLLPTNFFFRVSFSTDVNNNKDERADNHTDIEAKKDLTTDVSSKTTKSPDVEPKPCIQASNASSVKDQSESEAPNSDKQARKLPAWMSSSTAATPTSSRTDKTSSSVKRTLSSDEDKDSKLDATPNASNKSESSSTTPAETKSTSKPSETKSLDSDTGETFDSVSPKKLKSDNKPRPPCLYGATCYRKNPAHRTEASHPGDSDYEDDKETKTDTKKDDSDDDKPPCPYGKTCYRQNPQHKRDYKH